MKLLKYILAIILLTITIADANDATHSIFVLESHTTGKASIDRELTRRSLEVIKKRLALMGESGVSLEQTSNRRITIRFDSKINEAKEIINQSIINSRLEFRLVDDRAPQNSIPADSEVLYESSLEQPGEQLKRIPYIVKKKPALSGDIITSADLAFDQYTERPFISLNLNDEGAKRFAALTGEMVGKQLAIVVDGNVISAPVIRDSIAGGRLAVSGNFTMQSAQDIVAALSSNYLPSEFRIVTQQAPTVTTASAKPGRSNEAPSDVQINIPEGTFAGPNDVAVIIGNRNYSAGGVPDVDYALRDAALIKDYLSRTLGFDITNIIYLENATLTKLNEVFGTERDNKGKLFKWVKPGDSRVFIYYTGHGAPDTDSAEAYLVPVDANPQLIRNGGYRLQTLYDNLSKLPARQITVVIDACFSGNSAKGSLFTGTSALVRREKTVNGPINALVMTSASAGEVSSWYPEKGHSLFTYFFIKGLQGAADTNKDRRITAGEMRNYLAINVPYTARRLTGNEQQPVITGQDDAVLTVLTR